MSGAARRVVGIVGGTGPQGRGLGLRLAAAGHRVLLGSRDALRAEEAVGKVRVRAGEADLDLVGVANDEACEAADVVIVAVPADAQAATLTPLADAVAGKVVVSCANALAFDDRGPRPLAVEAGSAAEEVAALLPEARVVAAFHHVSAPKLLRAGEAVDCDVLVCGDDAEAKALVADLVAEIPGLRPVDAGPLRLARPIEDFTAVLLAVNGRYDTRVGVRLPGLATG